jgi:glycosyltransferase involved in cell wall biosynthesis
MFNTSPKIIFILPNIYECVNGVSTKYIQFIQYLINNQYYVTLMIPFIDHDILDNIKKYDNLKIIKVNGLNVPFYKEIKIPIITKDLLKKQLDNKNEIIIFNGEFIWLYTLLKKLKKRYIHLKLYPNMHTDYINYASNYYNDSFFSSLSIFKKWDITSVFNYTDFYLQEKIFSGIIVTGEKMKKKYINFTESIFNANEIDLSVFSSHKIDLYNNNNNQTNNILFNIIFCGRMSKEKNIEEILECCNLLYNNENTILLKNILKVTDIQFKIHMIGDGPYLDNLKNIIEMKYYNLKDDIIFYGSLKHNEINKLYNSLDNRLFLFTSLSETFGKTPMEASSTGIPIFIKKSDLTDYLYIHKKNAYIFENPIDFFENFKYFLNINALDKNIFISNSINNVKQYDQSKIFDEWIYFLINGYLKKKSSLNIFDIFTFHGITKMINCSGILLAD